MQALTSHGNLPVYEIGLPSKLCWRESALRTAINSPARSRKPRIIYSVLLRKYGDLRMDSGVSQGKRLLKSSVRKVPFPETVFYKGKKYVESNRKQNR